MVSPLRGGKEELPIRSSDYDEQRSAALSGEEGVALTKWFWILTSLSRQSLLKKGINVVAL